MPLVLERSWVGRRVVVRRVVDRAADGSIRFGDVVGDLLDLGNDDALLEAREEQVRVPLQHIALARIVHPSTADVLALEEIAARGWRAEDTFDQDGWLLRANGGYTGRANSALPLRATKALDAQLAASRAWYTARGLPLTVQSPLPARRLLDAELNERGWTAAPDVHVVAARLDVLRANSGPRQDHVAKVAAQPDAAWLAGYPYRPGFAPELANGLLTRHDRAGFAGVQLDGELAGIARGAVDSGWLGVFAVEVRPRFRRRGVATELMRALWQWAADVHGATRSYLQVEQTNQPAITMYLGQGYWHHHDYRYRREPDAPSSATASGC